MAALPHSLPVSVHSDVFVFIIVDKCQTSGCKPVGDNITQATLNVA